MVTHLGFKTKTSSTQTEEGRRLLARELFTQGGDAMIKNRLREIRHDMYINTQQEMARILDMNRQQYNRYENQQVQPDLETALRIAKKLNKPVEDIFYLEPDS